MSINATKSQGTTVAKGDGGSPENFTNIAEVRGTGGPNPTNAEMDVTDLDSTAKEYLSSLPDNGELTLDMLFRPGHTSHQALINDQIAQSTDNYQITFADGTTGTFPAFVREVSPSTAVDDPATMSVTLRVSGAVTWVFA